MFIIPPIGRLLKRDVLLIQIVPTVVVFLVLLTFALISWRSAETTLQVQKDQTVNEKMDTLEESIRNRMRTSEVLLRAGSGIFEASEAVSRDEWNRFFAKFDIQERFTGVSTVGYVPVIPASERVAFEESMRKDGVANFAITPNGDRPVYAPIMYFEQYRSNTNSVGFDMYTSKERKAAMDAAVQSGTIAMSDKIKFHSGQKLGVLVYMPVYAQGLPLQTAEQRQTALRGYIYTSLRLDELFANISNKKSKFEFAVDEKTESGATRQIYSSSKNAQGDMELQRTSQLEVFGQTWQVRLLSEGDFVSTTDSERPSTILTAGIAISFIASVAVYLLIQFRTRTFALTEERKLQQAKDELLSLASHQLRTPATGVKQYVGMVLDGFGGRLLKGQVKLLEQAYKSNERQLQIINEFLYVAKLGSGSLTTASHEFDIVPVLRDVVEEMSLDIQEKKHTLKVTTPNSVTIRADEHSIRMILENLLSNAIKYTQSHGHIEIVLQRKLQEVQVQFKDDGIGIAKKDNSLLFKQFSRIPNEFSTSVSGSGIGLYLSQQLAERNQGYIDFKSEVGKGSTFTLHLPAKSVRNLTKRQKKS